MPKAELHCHLEGTMESKLLKSFADKTSVSLENVERRKKPFTCLDDFVQNFEDNMRAVTREQDYYDMFIDYMEEALRQNIKHVEFQFELQTPLERKMDLPQIIRLVRQASDEAKEKYGISALIIVALIKARPKETSIAVIESVVPVKDLIDGLGLVGSEVGYPVDEFEHILKLAHEKLGPLKVSLHAGEEGSSKEVRAALRYSDRIDHGVTAIHDKDLIEEIKDKGICLTVCPLSNVALQVYKDIKDCPIRAFLDHGVAVCCNSDDPAYFGSLLNNFEALIENFTFNFDDLFRLASNSIEFSFASEERKHELLLDLKQFHQNFMEKENIEGN
eukprot:GHVP01061786.1.p1 GENE.GHVP01061786.1~~GHVP01061786.1.p1  ORF type:complete len:332 (+),score=69.32 GHVP01061786.1:322-1317(+)